MTTASDIVIHWEGISKAFGPKRIYDGLDLQVRRGETLTIIGGSGSGKSVLLKLLIGLLYPDQGHVWFEGQDVTTLGEAALRDVRRRVGMVFQSSALFDSLSVGENIAYPLREHRKGASDDEIAARVAKMLDMVNLPGIEHMNPADLSGGMRRRVGLARAIASEPEVILYDEPTTGLDPISVRVIDELILSMKRQLGCTSIVVTHDMASAFRVSDRIAMLARRKVVASGTVKEMLESTDPDVRAFFEAVQN